MAKRQRKDDGGHDIDIIARRPKPSVQDVLAGDINPAPTVLRSESPATGQTDADVPIDRYFSREWHDREVEKIWRKTWQLACRVEDIPNPGDQINYDIVHDSLLNIRAGDGRIKAYTNGPLWDGFFRILNSAGLHNHKPWLMII